MPASMGYSASLLLLSSLVSSTLGSALSFNRQACQRPTSNPLAGCPSNTLLVGQNYTSKHFKQMVFSTIQSAVESIANCSTPYNILILPGTYHEQVNVSTSAPLTLLGQTSQPNSRDGNGVVVTWSLATGNKVNTFDNAYTSTLTVAPSLQAALTGSGPTGYNVSADQKFGTTDFRAYNIDFKNEWNNYSDGPALALSIGYANTGFYFCGWYSYQDTIYIGKLGNAYFYKNEIAGQTDFLYGFGTGWIQSSLLSLRGCGGGITAWKGSNTTFVNKYGIYIHDSQALKANSSLNITGKCALGRPWNAQHRSIFANTYLDDSITPSGYIKWSSTDKRINYNTTMAEYKDYGPGFNLTGRLTAGANITIEMTDAQYKPYSTLEKIFLQPFSGREGNTAWIDRNPEKA